MGIYGVVAIMQATESLYEHRDAYMRPALTARPDWRLGEGAFEAGDGAANWGAGFG